MKKGFTLIELLAVIVILAIIAVIATPIVLNIISETKSNAALRSADFYLHAVEMSVAQSTLKNQTVKDGTYQINNGDLCLNDGCTEKLEVEANGETPEGSITISRGEIVLAQFISNNNIIVKNDKGELVYAALANDIINKWGGMSSIGEVSDFSKSTVAGESGLYKSKDDYGASYFLRGDVVDNYVQFGQYPEVVYWDAGGYAQYNSLEECQNDIGKGYPPDDGVVCTEVRRIDKMYWRIVRINGDGTIRLIYDGTEKLENGKAKPTSSVNNSQFNSYSGGHGVVLDAKYFGYTYDNNGGQTDSVVKGNLDSWYNSNIKGKYDSYIADSIFCNDKEEAVYEYFNQNYESTDKENAYEPYTNTLYGSNVRYSANTPSLLCKNKEDRYTVNDTVNGNGYLSNPVGLITSDEILMSGIVGVNPSKINYLYTATRYWTLSPSLYYINPLAQHLNMFIVYDNSLIASDLGEEHTIRPVINLKADVKFKGNGTIDSPYEIIFE